MDFKNINLTEFVRYILTGLNFLLFVLFLPYIFVYSSFPTGLSVEESFLTISLLSVTIGYLLDILKLYHFTPKFRKNRDAFRKVVCEIFTVPSDEAASYHSMTTKFWEKNTNYDLRRRRSEWLLGLQASVTFVLSSIVWAGIFSFTVVMNGWTTNLLIPMFAFILSLTLAFRLWSVSEYERKRMEKDTEIIMKENKEEIAKCWIVRYKVEKRENSAWPISGNYWSRKKYRRN
jgi:hypothetical protein